MKKIEFLNGQAPYLNQDNLMQLQKNMEEVSVPEGGVKGQVLRKVSNTDNDVEWETIIEDVLDSDSTTKALSAKQGKKLNEKIDNLVLDTLESESEINALSAKQGNMLKQKICNVLHEGQHNMSMSKSIIAGNWRGINDTDLKVSLHKGKYLLIVGAAFNASGTGIVSVRPVINNQEHYASTRSTIPLNPSLVTTGQVVTILVIDTDAEVMLNGQVYSDINCTIIQSDIQVIELTREV